MRLSLVLTHACNLACKYCYMGAKFDSVMPIPIALASVDHGLSQAQHLDLSFFGGEPLLAFRELRLIAAEATHRARAGGRTIRMQLTTNGTLLDAEMARAVTASGIAVAVSLDGPPALHDAMRTTGAGQPTCGAAMRGVQALREAGAAFSAVMVVTPSGAPRLAESVAWVADLNPARIALNPAYELDWSDENIAAVQTQIGLIADWYADRIRSGVPVAVNWIEDNLAAAVHERGWMRPGCGLGRSAIAVAPSGRIYPCDRMVRDDCDTRLAIGRVYPNGTVERSRRPRPVAPGGECVRCEEAWRCTYRCACANIAETGHWGEPGGVQCAVHKACALASDRVGHQLLAERCETFLERFYSIDGAVLRTETPQRTPHAVRVTHPEEL